MPTVLLVTLPIYLLIALGFVALRLGWMAPPDLRVLGRFAAQVCIPALLFRAIANQPLAAVFHLDYLFAYTAGSLVALGLVAAYARFGRGRPLSLAALQGLGASGSNSAFVGYPILQQMIGPSASVALAMNTVLENLIVMPLAMALADAGASNHRPRDLLAATFKGLARNPMIQAISAGALVSALGWHLPAVLDRTVAMVAAAAPPLALFVIGGSLVGLKLAGMRTDMALVTGGKLLLHPLCVLAMVWLVRPADPALRTAAMMFAAMPMLSIYPLLAQRYGHERFCAAALLATTLASFFTVSLLMLVVGRL